MPEDTDDGYDRLAKRADDLPAAESPWGDSAFQRAFAWPATRERLPDLDGARVLLAGCGRGDHVPELLDGGASVVGVDASVPAVGCARERVGSGAGVLVADLTAPLPFESGVFDAVVNHLVLSHIEDWTATFREFHRVLAAGGTALVTTVHPAYFRRHHGVGHAGVERFESEWADTALTTYARPMSAAVTPLVEAGFELELLDEPRPPEAYREAAPSRYDRAVETPELLCLRATA